MQNSTQDTLTIRPVTPADAGILTEIEAACFPPAEACPYENFEKRLAVFSEGFLILEKNGRPVGFIDGMVTDQPTISDDMFADASMHNPEGRWQSIFGLAVRPEERRQGYAGMLIRAFIEKARNEGRRGLILTCKDHLVHYYASFGFVLGGVSASVHGGAKWNDMTLDFTQQK